MIRNYREDSMEVMEAILTRRSTRRYQDRAVEREKVEKIIEMGRYAPTGSNVQYTHFLVIQSKPVLDRLAELAEHEFATMREEPGMHPAMIKCIRAAQKGGYVFHYHAPVLVITAIWKDYGNNQADCACALENMMLTANALDLGSCWINQLKWLNESPVLLEYLQSLGMKDNERVYGSLALGYAATDSGLPIRNPLPRTGNPVTYIE